MKSLLIKCTFILLALVLALAAGCGALPAANDGGKAGAEKQAIDTLAQFSIVNRLATYRMLEIFSGGYTQPLFGEQVAISAEDYAALNAMMAELGAYQGAVTAAVKVLVPPEYVRSHGVTLAGLAAPGAEMAAPPASPGVLTSFLEFFGVVNGAGERSRQRITSITQNASDAQIQQMYNELRPDWKAGIKDSQEWLQKLKAGEFDSRASQMHNDFVHNPDLGFYADLAQAEHATTEQIVYEEGGEMVEKGAKFYGEVATTVVGKALPGFDKGVEAVQDLNEQAENFQKYADTYYQDGFTQAVNEAIKDSFEKKLGDTAGATFGDELGDAIVHFAQKATGEDKADSGQAKVEGDYPSIVAFNKDDAAPVVMQTYVGDAGQPSEMELPAGDYIMVATDETGADTGQNENVAVTGGGEVSVVIEPVAPAGDTLTDLMGNAQDKMQDVLSGIDEAADGLPDIDVGDTFGGMGDMIDKATSGAGGQVNEPAAADGNRIVGTFNAKYETDEYRVEVADGSIELMLTGEKVTFGRNASAEMKAANENTYILKGESTGQARVWVKNGDAWDGPLTVDLDGDTIQGNYSPGPGGKVTSVSAVIPTDIIFDFGAGQLDAGVVNIQADLTDPNNVTGQASLGWYNGKMPMTGKTIRKTITTTWQGRLVK